MICPKCQTSLVGLPREEYPFIRSKSLIQEAAPLPKPSKPMEESLPAKLLLLLLKTFGIACIIGITVLIVGWQYLGWNSDRQFSDGLFWTGAAVALLGYYIYQSERRDRRAIITALRVQPTGTLGMQERTKLWLANAASSSRLAFQFFLVTIYLITFAALVWNLF